MTKKGIDLIEKEFKEYVKKISAYNEALALIFWDLRTGAPKKGVEQRSEVIGVLSSEVFNMSTSKEMESFIAELSMGKASLSETTNKMVQECKKDFERNKKIPANEYKEFVILQSRSESAWEEAREKADFSLFQPYLEQIVAYTRRFVEYWGYEGTKYNTLLDMYEPGMTVDVLDSVFSELRSRIVPLVKQIATSEHRPETGFLYKKFPKEKQHQLNLEILKQLGYDFKAGRLDETVHPFEIRINRGDVRVTTRYDENDFRGAIFGTIHECGHAIYEQNIANELTGTLLDSGTSMGIHESQSLFFENFIGRNHSFWKNKFSLLKEYAPEQFNDVTLDEFYRGINESKPSFIRIEADELTYPLHIMIRYELEKALFNGELEVKDLPEVWNEKYKDYLGIVPENDAMGVLQDVHWADGSFGYFPSYALGYMYAAQIKQAMLKDLPDFDGLLEAGDIAPIREWLNEKIHKYGKTKKPLEILKETTGEGLNVQYLIKYLEDKYKEVYKIK
ncbi:carboxypeptidase M32 [Peribacillus frigoritolerans]|uniref:carboxypeptidase M32 n=1 Tax=Peribacillus frigoritolerans TaxID=450367 RepID=UPI0006AC321C|nr:carboxypeptidase M32 [Peribacillus frigoritolerans]KOR79447.1 peptidase M32 [Bacillus sp. FJAT-21352]KOR86876.1 peptidase M32 [Bacillus sp. FJAT-22058]MCY9141957.1 carboxypeptidase M32 [Peribacillus frigoritolerans]USK78426.1 carboxypeptidase M32 [Peribacillus frigoritolerans]WJE45758.1 carboxypeptidase M32 [Peribacillus frigoritolerans]